MQTIRLPVIEQEVAFWDFMEILFEELRCEMFYTRDRKPTVAIKETAAADKTKKRRISESPDSNNASPAARLSPESEKKRRRLQVSLKRLDAVTAAAAGVGGTGKKSRLGLNKERNRGGEAAATASSSSSSSPVHSPSHSLSPANSSTSSR